MLIMKHPYSARTRAYFLMLLSVLTIGCSSKSPAALSNFSEDSASLSREAKLNSQQSKELLTVNSVFIAMPIIGRNARDADPKHLRSLIKEAFKAESSMTLVPEKSGSTSPCEEARLLHADACLVLTIDSYGEMNGTSMAANELSKISYTLELVKVSDKHLLFQKTFGFHDQSISENLLSANDTIDQKGGSSGYASAASVFSRSVRQAIRELDNLRTKQFLG